MDSIGTKPIVARARGALRNCGADMAAHCINDVATCGADPLILLDYMAASRVRLEDVAELVDGAAEVCREAGVALVGGETAELPGVYHDGELDFPPPPPSPPPSPAGSAAARGASPTPPAAASAAPCRASCLRELPPSSTGTAGSDRRSSAGSRATSTRRSCAACSTSGSAGALSSP